MIEQERLKEIHDRIAEIKSSVMDAMAGTIQEAEMVLSRLNAAEGCLDEWFQERAEEAKPLLTEAIAMVEKIIDGKYKELKAAEEEAESEPETPPEDEPEEEVTESLYPLTNYANDILQYANHLRDESDWLDESDREILQRLANEIESLSNDVQERKEA